jgi:hypothetical protein
LLVTARFSVARVRAVVREVVGVVTVGVGVRLGVGGGVEVTVVPALGW